MEGCTGLPSGIAPPRRGADGIRAVRFGDLAAADLAAWSAIHSRRQEFASPFFGPGYVNLLAQVRDTVRVAVIYNDDLPVGFFPYELHDCKEAIPVGSYYCDYQAVVAEPHAEWTVSELLRACGLQRWHFDHLLAFQRHFVPFHKHRDVSWVIGLEDGFDAYAHRQQKLGRRQLIETRRKVRMIERELGTVRFEPTLRDPEMLDLLLAWKGKQWEDSGWKGRFSTPWEQALMRTLLACRGPEFAGMLSGLFANDRPLALHLGMRSRTTWHYWTTAYDPALRRYSPGIVMLVEILRAAEKFGCGTVDLGKEDFEYKRRLATYLIPLAEGVVDIS